MSCNRNSTSRCWHLRPRSKVATGVVQKARQMKWPSFRYWSPYFGQEDGITIKMIPGTWQWSQEEWNVYADDRSVWGQVEYPCLRLLPTKSQQMVFRKERCNRQRQHRSKWILLKMWPVPRKRSCLSRLHRACYIGPHRPDIYTSIHVFIFSWKI